MNPIILIAANFLREQRWVLVALVASVILLSSLASWDTAQTALDEVLFFLKQQALYGVAFSMFLASAAIHNDRRSRRILAVLSKGITRREYLAGLLLGVWGASFVYCVAMTLAGVVVFPRARVPQPSSWIIIVGLMLVSMLTSAISLLFATMMPPLVAAMASALTLGAMSAIAYAVPATAILFPMFTIVEMIGHFSPSTRLRWSAVLPFLTVTLLEAILAWAMASRVFAVRDVAIPVE